MRERLSRAAALGREGVTGDPQSEVRLKFDALRRDMDRTVRHTNRLNAVLVGLLGVGVIGGLVRLFLFAGP